MTCRNWFVGVVVVVTATTGCSLTATLLPVSGPLSLNKPVPTIDAKASGVMGNSGGLSWKMPDGEACKGRWSVIDLTTTESIGGGSLLTNYGSVYLSGYSVTSAAGMNRGYALATCAKGRTFEIEFVSRGHGYGIAKDSDENIYRFVF